MPSDVNFSQIIVFLLAEKGALPTASNKACRQKTIYQQKYRILYREWFQVNDTGEFEFTSQNGDDANKHFLNQLF